MRPRGVTTIAYTQRPSGIGALLLRLLGVLLMLTALAVALSRAPDRPVQTLVARWAPPPSDFVTVQGQVVHLRDEGPRDDPMPIVLLHGAAASLHSWEGWVKALRRRHRVVTFDLPGSGLTGPWSDDFGGDYPHRRYEGDADARFTLALMDRLQIRRAVLGGHALGGEVAWRVASLAPDRVGALVLVDASGPAVDPIAVPVGLALARMPLASRVGEWLLPRSLVAQTLAELDGDPARVTPDRVDRYFELLLREGNRHALGVRLQNQRPGRDAGRIAALRVPTLLLWGGRDRLIPPKTAQAFLQIPGSRLVVFDALGHLPQEEDPAATVAPVRDFMDALAPPAARAASAAAPS